MSKYIVNHTVDGYETIPDITDERLVNSEGNDIIVVLDESTSSRLRDYYNSITDILLTRNKLCIIVVGKESKIRKPICTLSSTYRNYNLYKVDSKIVITTEYLDTIIERNPTIDEVQSFIGGDISGYSDINAILTGIESLVSDGNIDGLKQFIENHINSVEALPGVVEYMRKIVETTNSGELLDRIDDLKARVRDSLDKLELTEKENKTIKDENLRLIEDTAQIKTELSKAITKAKELEAQASSSSGPVIKSYSEINTSMIKCKTTHILYFKEVSYVPYMNSLIIILMEAMKLSKKRAKLLIYDSKVGLSTIYKPLSVISGNEFVSNKDNFIGHTEAFVAVEPNPTILSSILESMNPVFDVVIVYDRMRQLTNIVSGNNVTKYYVINSSKDFKEVQGQLRITDKTSIISRPGSSIGSEVLNIPFIEDYNVPGTTNSAKISKYMKLKASGNNKPLISTILEKARITGR